MPSQPLRVAVVGFWHVHAVDYARSVEKHPATELVAVWDDDRERGAEGAARFGVEFVDSLDALLARDDIDAVTITTATAVHRDVMVAAARAGKHIFTEKLLAPTVEEAQEIVRVADDRDVKLMVSLPRLYAGYTAAIRGVLADGRLGDVTYARVRLSHAGAVKGWLPDRFFDPGPAVGGALTDLGCHPVYLTQLVLGARPESVSATYRSVTGRAVEDHAVVIAGYASAIGVIEAGFVSEDPFEIDVFGTQGRLRYSEEQPDRLAVRGAAFGEGVVSLPVPADGPDAFGQWVDHIANGSRADENIERAMELTRLVVAANASAATGRSVGV